MQFTKTTGNAFLKSGTYKTQELPCHCGPGNHIFNVYSRLTCKLFKGSFRDISDIWCKYTSVINPYLKYESCLTSFEEIQI